MAIPKANRLENYMCEMLTARGLPLPKGYQRWDVNDIGRADNIMEDIDYDIKCLQLAAMDRIANDIRKIRNWIIFWGVLGVIALIISILF